MNKFIRQVFCPKFEKHIATSWSGGRLFFTAEKTEKVKYPRREVDHIFAWMVLVASALETLFIIMEHTQ